jgi:hypothetical protein
MGRVSIEVTDDFRAKMAVRAAETGHDSVEAYLTWLAYEDADSEDFGAPTHLRPQSAERLEEMLLQAMKSPIVEVTPAFWEEKRQKLREKFGKSQGQ